jgi:hypothetical protein
MPTLARRLSTLALAVAAVAVAAPAEAQLRAGFRSTLAPRGDDTVTPFANLGFNANIRGGTYNSASACMNGYLSLGIPFDPSTCIYPGQTTALATLPQFGEVFGTAVVGLFRDLNSTPVASGQLGYGSGTVDGQQAFGFTWDGVFSFGTTNPNFFQILFINRAGDFAAGDFDIEYNYGTIVTGAAVAGVADDGGFSGAAYTSAVTPIANSRSVQCFRGGSVNNQLCSAEFVIPEPSTVALTVVGLGALAGVGLRRRRTA